MRYWFIVCLLLIGVPAMATNSTAADLDRVTQQFCTYVIEHEANPPGRVVGYLATLRADGTWADIDYHSQEWAAWQTASHLERTLQMAIAWRRGGVPGATPQALLAAVHLALGHWELKDYQCPNWWDNQIEVPRVLGTTALLLGHQIQPDEFNYITRTVMPRSKIGMTGQNRVWLAGNTLLAGLLQQDASVVQQAAEVIFSEIVVSTREGIQPDFSFHQHGPQQQFGNYGMAFASDMVKWAQVLRNSSWALPQNELQILREYLLNGESWVIWRGNLDISACGRQLSPGSPASKGKSLLRVLTTMQVVDPGHADDYKAAIRRNATGAINDLVGNRYFWCSDYMVDRRPDFCATLKLSSTRVIGTESINLENLSGYYLGDGALYVYRTGQEYTDIFPVWNWRQLPGVTCAQGTGPLPIVGANRLPTTFVGGVSNGQSGGMAVDYRRDGVVAKKAWFFFDNQIVCLGAGIGAEATVSDPVMTTVNQCLLQGPVRVGADGVEHLLDPGPQRMNDLAWVDQDGIRYVFPTPQSVTINSGPVTGSWHAVAHTSSYSRDAVIKNVFTIAIDHGVHPDSASYAYIIRPVEADQQPPVKILQNTPRIQAAQVNGIMQSVFYTPGSLTYDPGRTLVVDAPCLVMLDTATSRAWVSDPGQGSLSVTLTLDGTAHEIHFPQGDFEGQTRMIDLK